MSAKAETERVPETTGGIPEVVVGITPGQREFMTHREAYMSHGQTGWITVDWFNTAQADLTYYEYAPYRKPRAWDLDVMDALKNWRNGSTPEPELIGNGNVFKRAWSTHVVVGEDRILLRVVSKDFSKDHLDGEFKLLTIKADPPLPGINTIHE